MSRGQASSAINSYGGAPFWSKMFVRFCESATMSVKFPAVLQQTFCVFVSVGERHNRRDEARLS
jgi:hypothetical protein